MLLEQTKKNQGEDEKRCAQVCLSYIYDGISVRMSDNHGSKLAANGLGTFHSDRYYQSITTSKKDSR